MTQTDLIFDVGMHNGDDTAFYLYQGYRVLAVEADPTLAEAASIRFADQIAAGRLTVCNAGIAESSGTATFWISDDKTEWNSFDRRIAARNGNRHHAVQIKTLRFGELLARFGVPVYLKIDIEGADHLCLRDLRSDALPSFVSTEVECVGDEASAEDMTGVDNLRILSELGYTRFKLISQDHFSAVARSTMRNRATDLLNSLAYGGLRRLSLARLAAPLTDLHHLKRTLNWQFRSGCSGPWGEQTPGEWLTAGEVALVISRAKAWHFRRSGRSAYSFWYDLHASVSD